jgi:hypothetical protein
MTQDNSPSKPLIIGEIPKTNLGIVQSSSTNFYHLPIERLSKAEKSDVLKIAASQIELLSNYHQEVLSQAKKSFLWALIAAGAGFFFFLGTLAFIMSPKNEQKTEFAVIGTIGGVMIEVISALNFYLYGKAAIQMAEFQQRLDTTQRFLLANSICEALEGEIKHKARSELVRVIAGIVSTSEGNPLLAKPSDIIEKE